MKVGEKMLLFRFGKNGNAALSCTERVPATILRIPTNKKPRAKVEFMDKGVLVQRCVNAENLDKMKCQNL